MCENNEWDTHTSHKPPQVPKTNICFIDNNIIWITKYFFLFGMATMLCPNHLNKEMPAAASRQTNARNRHSLQWSSLMIYDSKFCTEIGNWCLIPDYGSWSLAGESLVNNYGMNLRNVSVSAHTHTFSRKHAAARNVDSVQRLRNFSRVKLPTCHYLADAQSNNGSAGL